MRLTFPLFLFKNPKGHLFRGKYRLVKKVSKEAMDTLKFKLEQEEKNMFYLRHPYLNKSETKCMMELEGRPNWTAEFRDVRNAKFERRKTLEQELSHLKVSQNWDFKGGY